MEADDDFELADTDGLPAAAMDHRDNAASERTAVGTTESLEEEAVERSEVTVGRVASEITGGTVLPASRGLG